MLMYRTHSRGSCLSAAVNDGKKTIVDHKSFMPNMFDETSE